MIKQTKKLVKKIVNRFKKKPSKKRASPTCNGDACYVPPIDSKMKRDYNMALRLHKRERGYPVSRSRSRSRKQRQISADRSLAKRMQISADRSLAKRMQISADRSLAKRMQISADRSLARKLQYYN